MRNNEVKNIKELVERVHYLMGHYFDALENSIHSTQYSFKAREEDARVFNALAQTLIRLTQLGNLIKPLEGEHDDESIQANLEQRLLKVVEPTPNKDLPQ